MTVELFALSFDANDPQRLAGFWAGVLGREMTDDHRDGGVALLPNDDTGFRLRFVPSEEKKFVANRMHFDLTSASLEEQEQTVARALDLGGRHIDVGLLPEEGHVVLADPRAKVTWGGPPVAPKPGKNRLHFDLAPSADGDHQAEVDRLISLGARRIDIGQGEVEWAVLADPDDNEFCVLTARQRAAATSSNGWT